MSNSMYYRWTISPNGIGFLIFELGRMLTHKGHFDPYEIAVALEKRVSCLQFNYKKYSYRTCPYICRIPNSMVYLEDRCKLVMLEGAVNISSDLGIFSVSKFSIMEPSITFNASAFYVIVNIVFLAIWLFLPKIVISIIKNAVPFLRSKTTW